MKFNGVDPTTLHPAISIAKEIYPSMPAREITTVETGNGEMIANVSMQQDEAIIRVNIAARTYDEAAEARMALAKWAASSQNQTAELEPTHMPEKAYAAILKRIQPIEKRFAAVDVVFLLPRPVLHEITERRVTGSGAGMTFTTGGSASVQPVFELTPDEDAEGLVMLIDGQTMLALSGTIGAGEKVEYNLKTGSTTIGGIHAENRILYADIDPDIELMPEKHTLNVSTAGSMTVRWHNEWL